jgi:NitT/TauT family transport system substrate-binding protein
MKNILSLFVTSLAFISSLSFAANPPAAVAAPTELKLALNWKAEPQFGGFYTGAQSGIFQKQNLKVQILEGGSGTPTIQMLATGQIDYAVVSADEIILAHDRGAKDVVAIFAVYQTNPQGIMTHAERNFEKIDQVFQSDGTLLWQAGLPYAQFIQKKYGKLKVKTAPYLGGIGNFQKDPHLSQQCFVTSEPLTAEKAGLKVKTFLVADTGYNPYTTVVAVKASRFKEHPEEVKKMVAALREAWGQYLANPQPTNQYMQSLNKMMDMETFQKSAAAQVPLIQVQGTALGHMEAARWQTLTQQLLDLKLIKSKPQASDLFQNL